VDKKRILLIFLSTFLVVGSLLSLKIFVLDYKTPNLASLRVESIPQATVYLGGKNLGQTPILTEKLLVGEYQLRLVPVQSIGNQYLPWETKVRINGGSLTFVSRELGPTDEDSAGQVLTLENAASQKSAEVVIVSTPDGSSVFMDAVEKGKTSIIITDITPGDHTFTVTQPGYSDQVIRGRIVAGYRLNALVKLKKITDLAQIQSRPTAELVASSSAQSPPQKPYVVVKDTPLGFLRVRFEPDLTATEVGKIYPGEEYSFVESSGDWVKIKGATISGWAAQTYLEKIP